MLSPVVIRSSNNISQIKRELRKIGRSEIKVGVMEGGEVGMIAAVHEFGTTIQVTDKMRGWFAANGYPLKKDTTEIIIPERSFIRAGFDANINRTANKIEQFLPLVIQNNISADEFLNAIGLDLASHIRDFTNELSSPPNSKMTKDRKGSSNPLIDSGRLRDAIKHKVE